MKLNNNLAFHRERLNENIEFMNDFFLKNEMTLTFVIKAFSLYPNSFIEQLSDLSCLSIASDNEAHLEILKQQVNRESSIVLVFTITVLAVFLVNSTSCRSRYYTSFLVESVPIMALILTLLLN